MTLFKKISKKVLLFLGILGLLFLVSTPVLSEDFDVAAKHAFALETSTGKILYAKDSDTPVAIASTTKLLTIYLVYQAIEEGRLNWDTTVAISDYAYDLTTRWELSNVPMNKRSYTVKELVDASLLTSSNSAAIALAEHLAGSEPAFVDLMKQQLKNWGISDAKLVNVTGLNNEYLGTHIYPNSQNDDENTMSAKSLAKIAYHLILDYPDILTITSKATGTFDGNPISNTNAMLTGMPRYREGVDGLKTGSTERSGHSFVASAAINNMHVITVILDADNPNDDPYARFDATNALLDNISEHFELQNIMDMGKEIDQIPIQNGHKATAVTQSALVAVITKDLKNETPFKSHYKTNLTAPITAKQVLGKLSYQDNNLIDEGYISKAPSVAIIAKEPIEANFFLNDLWNKFIHYLDKTF